MHGPVGVHGYVVVKVLHRGGLYSVVFPEQQFFVAFTDEKLCKPTSLSGIRLASNRIIRLTHTWFCHLLSLS